MGRIKMLDDLRGNNHVKGAFEQKRPIRSVIDIALIKANPWEASSRSFNATPVSLNAHNPIARCAHGRAQGPIAAAQIQDPPSSGLSQNSQNARF